MNKTGRYHATYTVNGQRLIWNMVKSGATLDEICAKFPDKPRDGVRQKIYRMGLKVND